MRKKWEGIPFIPHKLVLVLILFFCIAFIILPDSERLSQKRKIRESGEMGTRAPRCHNNYYTQLWLESPSKRSAPSQLLEDPQSPHKALIGPWKQADKGAWIGFRKRGDGEGDAE